MIQTVEKVALDISPKNGHYVYMYQTSDSIKSGLYLQENCRNSMSIEQVETGSKENWVITMYTQVALFGFVYSECIQSYHSHDRERQVVDASDSEEQSTIMVEAQPKREGLVSIQSLLLLRCQCHCKCELSSTLPRCSLVCFWYFPHQLCSWRMFTFFLEGTCQNS